MIDQRCVSQNWILVLIKHDISICLDKIKCYISIFLCTANLTLHILSDTELTDTVYTQDIVTPLHNK